MSMLNFSTSRMLLLCCCWMISILLLVGSFLAVTGAFQTSSSIYIPSRLQKAGYTKPLLFNEEGDGNIEKESETVTNDNLKKMEGKKSLDELLDQPFFDPDKVTKDDPLPVQWFADLVKNDYATAETLFAGLLFVVMVVVWQELLRIQIYGLDGYVPFSAGVRPGQLF